jgi:hypothetical protein
VPFSRAWAHNAARTSHALTRRALCVQMHPTHGGLVPLYGVSRRAREDDDAADGACGRRSMGTAPRVRERVTRFA